MWPQVAMYHAKVRVNHGAASHVLAVDADDWMPGSEILQHVAKSLGVSTPGEIVQALLDGPAHRPQRARDFGGVRSVYLSDDPTHCYEQADWDEPII